MLRARRASKRALSFPGSAWECTAARLCLAASAGAKSNRVQARQSLAAVRPSAEPGDEKRIRSPQLRQGRSLLALRAQVNHRQRIMIDALKQIIERHWGFRSFRPLQEPAMRAVLEGRDSIVVMPTGGGKSLCYQAPAVLRGDTTVVVSPLIALMKDQVDNLRAAGVPAVQIDSSLTATERVSYEQDVVQGAVRLLFVSPERLVGTDFYQLLKRV